MIWRRLQNCPGSFSPRFGHYPAPHDCYPCSNARRSCHPQIFFLQLHVRDRCGDRPGGRGLETHLLPLQSLKMDKESWDLDKNIRLDVASRPYAVKSKLLLTQQDPNCAVGSPVGGALGQVSQIVRGVKQHLRLAEEQAKTLSLRWTPILSGHIQTGVLLWLALNTLHPLWHRHSLENIGV